MKGNTELSYRLKTTAAKILSILGYDVYGVQKVIEIAYEIRSSFAHGDQIADSTRKKMKHASNIIEVLQLTLEILRVILILFVALKLNKSEFLTLTEQSMLDPQKMKDLRNLISGSRDFIVLPESKTFLKIGRK